MFKKKKKVEPVSAKKENFNNPQNFFGETQIYSMAIVLDGKIQDIIRAEVRLAAMLLSDPIIVDVTEHEQHPQIGWIYNDDSKEFINPNE
jgi:hypothetical protein